MAGLDGFVGSLAVKCQESVIRLRIRGGNTPANSGVAFTAGSDISADKTSSLKVEKVLNDIILVGVNIGMLFEEDLV